MEAGHWHLKEAAENCGSVCVGDRGYWGLSLVLPELYLEDQTFQPGIVCFLSGWVGLDIKLIAWLANPTLALGVCFLACRKPRSTLMTCSISIACAMATFLVDDILRNAAGCRIDVVGYGLGFYLWLVSCLLPAVGAVVVLLYEVENQSEFDGRRQTGFDFACITTIQCDRLEYS